MDLIVTLLDDAASPDELRALRTWLLEEDELRGCIQTREQPPGPENLGTVLDALRVVADPAAAVLTASMVAWLKTRVSDVRLVLTLRHGGTMELEAKKVQSLDPDALAELTERLTRLVNDNSSGDDPAEKTDASANADKSVGEGSADHS
ncbi:MAG TPA: hypothetical protein VIY28_05500 [Pseudonocardiaceae bacterium]